MANKITLEALQENMRVKLQAFNKNKVEITNDTVHKSVLDEGDAKKASRHKKLYEGAIRWTVWENEGKDSKWPSGWLDMSVTELAEFIMSKQPTTE